MSLLSNLLPEPRLRGLEPGSPEYFRIQLEMIRSRPLLKDSYDLWYGRLLRDEATVPPDRKGRILELGAGFGYVKQIAPRVITSDVLPGLADLALDACALPFPDRSLRAIFLVQVLHHIPDIERFLREAQRTLVPGGVVGIIDPACTPLSRIFFRHFHHEPFLPHKKDWEFASVHHMRSSNSALTWMVFVRDRQRFESLFPGLAIEPFEYLPWIGYTLSGGVTRRKIIPDVAAGFVKLCDALAAPLRPFGTLIWHITLRKRSEA